MMLRNQPCNLRLGLLGMTRLSQLGLQHLPVLLERTKVKEQQLLPSRNALSSFSAPYFGLIV
jgi:hypothetical protein